MISAIAIFTAQNVYCYDTFPHGHFHTVVNDVCAAQIAPSLGPKLSSSDQLSAKSLSGSCPWWREPLCPKSLPLHQEQPPFDHWWVVFTKAQPTLLSSEKLRRGTPAPQQGINQDLCYNCITVHSASPAAKSFFRHSPTGVNPKNFLCVHFHLRIIFSWRTKLQHTWELYFHSNLLLCYLTI